MTAPPTDKTHHSVQHSLVSERGLSRCKWPKVVGNESSQSDNPSTDDEYASSDGEQTSVDRTFSLPSLSVTGSARRLPSMIPSQHQFLNSQMLYSGPVLSGLGFSKPEQPAIDLSFSQSSSNSTVHNSQTSTDSAEVFPVITPAPKEENVLAAGPTLDNQTVAATDVTLVSGDSKKEEKVLECKKKKGNESRTANRDLADSDRYLKDLKRKREGTHSEHNSFPLPKRAKVEESGIHFPPSWEIIDLTLSSDSDSLTEEDEASTQIESFPIGGVKCEGQCDVNGCGLPFTMHENGPSEKGLRPVQVIKVEVSRTSSSKCVSNKPTPTSAMDDYLVHHSREASPIGGAGLPTLRPCSREATPVGGAGSPPFSPQSLGSPCFLPLTPEKNRETTESILRNNYSFL